MDDGPLWTYGRRRRRRGALLVLRSLGHIAYDGGCPFSTGTKGVPRGAGHRASPERSGLSHATRAAGAFAAMRWACAGACAAWRCCGLSLRRAYRRPARLPARGALGLAFFGFTKALGLPYQTPGIEYPPVPVAHLARRLAPGTGDRARVSCYVRPAPAAAAARAAAAAAAAAADALW